MNIAIAIVEACADMPRNTGGERAKKDRKHVFDRRPGWNAIGKSRHASRLVPLEANQEQEALLFLDGEHLCHGQSSTRHEQQLRPAH